MSALDIQHGGDHYKNLGIQPVQFWHANLMGGSESACIKYVTRWKSKEGVKDLRKARHFLQLIVEDGEYPALYRRQGAAFPIYIGMGLRATDYIDANGLEKPEAGVVLHVWLWTLKGDPADLRSAMQWMDELLRNALDGVNE